MEHPSVFTLLLGWLALKGKLVEVVIVDLFRINAGDLLLQDTVDTRHHVEPKRGSLALSHHTTIMH